MVNAEGAGERGSGLRVFGRLFLLAASGVALYLTWVALTQSPVAGCEAGSGCRTVLASKWSQVLGFPVAGAGVLTYLALIGVSFQPDLRRPLVFLVAVVLGAALWFVVVQAVFVRAFCPWCCLTHGLASLGALLLMASQRARGARGSVVAPVVAALALVAATALVQYTAEEKKPVTVTGETDVEAVARSGENRGSVRVHGEFTFDVADFPAMGDPVTAEHLVVGVFDFTCGHCLRLHRAFDDILAEYDGRVAVLELPGFFDDKGRAIHEMMLAVYREAPEVHAEVAAMLYARPSETPVEEVQMFLGGMLGEDVLAGMIERQREFIDAALAQTRQVIEENRRIVGTGKLPQLVLGKTVVVGSRIEAAYYYDLFENALGAQRGPSADLTFAPAALDFGKVVARATESATLTLKNEGAEPIAISAIEPPVGFSTRGGLGDLSPGETKTVEVLLNPPLNLRGALAEALVVKSNASDPQLAIPCQAEVLGIMVDPPSLDLGTVPAGSSTTASVEITFDLPSRITDVSAPHPFFEAQAAEQVDAGHTFRVEVTAAIPADTRPSLYASRVDLAIAPADPAIPWPEQINVPVRVLVKAGQ